MISGASKTPFPAFWIRYSWIKINSTIELANENGKAKTSRSTWNVFAHQNSIFLCLSLVITYNQFHNILRLFDVLPNFSLTTSETMGDYYLPTWYIPVASRVAIPSKIDAYPSEEGPFSLEDFPPIFLNDYSKNYFW